VKRDYGVRTEQRLIKEVIRAVNEFVKDVNGELMVGRLKFGGFLTFERVAYIWLLAAARSR
jgi:hypothetical protein